MSKYIDTDKFYASQAARCWGEPIKGTCTSDNALLADELQKLPISDVVEVIRCKDCRHYKLFTEYNEHFCNEFGGYVVENDFCSRAEKKGEQE